MSRRTTRIFLGSFLLAGIFSYASAQTTPASGTPIAPAAAPSPISITATSSPDDLAKAALTALGGPNFINLKSLVLSGSADLYAPTSTQSLPAKFVVVESGSRYRIEIQSPMFTFRQITNGDQTFTSIPNIQVPAFNRFGLSVLRNINAKGYSITALPDRKKLRAFRITGPGGDATDYYIDPQNGWIMSFEANFEGHGFGVDHKTFKLVEGILVPYSFSERFTGPQGDFIAQFKVKDVKVNQPIDDDVFQIPQQ